MALSSRMSTVDSNSHATIIKTLANKYDEITNPTGLVNLAVAENTLMHDELAAYINDKVTFNASVFTYGNGGSGSEQLRSSMAEFLNIHFKPIQPLDASSLICTNGMTSAIESLAFALADEGDAFLLARPCYGAFPHVLYDRPRTHIVGVSFGDIDPFSLESISAYETALRNAQAGGTRVCGIILCHSHNPLGHCYSPTVLAGLMGFAGNHGLHLISDEIYALSSWTSAAFPQTFSAFTSVLAINPDGLMDPAYIHCLWGMSKDFGASGFRIATVVSPRNVSSLGCIATRGLFTFPSGPTDAIVAHILSDARFCDEYFAESRTRLSAAHNVALQSLEKHKIRYAVLGGSAFFFWVDLGEKLASIKREKLEATKSLDDCTTSRHLEDNDLSRNSINAGIAARLVQHKVYLASGDASGSERPGWFRMVFSHPRSYVEMGLSRMLEALHSDRPYVDLGPAAMSCCICV